MNLPSHWPRMSIDAKAWYLVNTHQARSYSAACAMLSRRRFRPVPVAGVVAAMENRRLW